MVMRKNNSRTPYEKVALENAVASSANLVYYLSNLFKTGNTGLLEPIFNDLRLLRVYCDTVGKYSGYRRFLDGEVQNIQNSLSDKAWENNPDIDADIIWQLYLVHFTVKKIRNGRGRILSLHDFDNIMEKAQFNAGEWKKLYKGFLKEKNLSQAMYT
jgi:hypothetical protein